MMEPQRREAGFCIACDAPQNTFRLCRGEKACEANADGCGFLGLPRDHPVGVEVTAAFAALSDRPLMIGDRLFLPISVHQRLSAAILLSLLVAVLAGCGSTAKKPASTPPAPTSTAAKPAEIKPARPGAYYLDDGPGTDGSKNSLAHIESIPDAIPRAEKFHSGANKPYTIFGRSYVPVVNQEPFQQRGVASWYGRKYHGNMTSNGEIYDMYAMSAAHPTLPLPSYVRVTNPANQKSVVVRVNDRGPFLSDRIIDLSYAAAAKLDLARRGSGLVHIERVFAGADSAAPSAPVASPPRPPSTSPGPTAVTISPVVSEGTQFYLQLGAFGNPDNAEIFRTRLARELDWNREPITATLINGLWRVRMGPYSTRTEADAIIDRIKASHDFSPLISKP